MAFNLPQFLRRTSKETLQSYLAFRAVDIADDFDWAAPQSSYLRTLRNEVETLAEGHREEVYTDFENATLLSDDPGQLAFLSVFPEGTPFRGAFERIVSRLVV
jgi:hypothetical protein